VACVKQDKLTLSNNMVTHALFVDDDVVRSVILFMPSIIFAFFVFDMR
jgi:hypothetical protein